MSDFTSEFVKFSDGELELLQEIHDYELQLMTACMPEPVTELLPAASPGILPAPSYTTTHATA